MNTHQLEQSLRRRARRQDVSLAKSRGRNTGYMLVDVTTNSVVAGGAPVAYSLTLDDVERWLTPGEQPP